jgi:NIMA (never in mitosis gene a)-related kinase
MEYAEGGDLYAKILKHKKNGTKFSEFEIWDIFIQIVKSLKTLHEKSVFHRDLKSANVFLTLKNEV